jgi:RecA-family ATPase
MYGSVRELLSSPPEPNPQWIGGGMLPKQGILLLGGPAKTRKSFLALDLADSLTMGKPVWGVETLEVKEKASTLYVEGEIGPIELYRRLEMRYTTLKREPPENFTFVSKEKNMLVDTSSGIHNLARYIEKSEAKVVILDPISRLMMGEENDSNAVGALFRRLDDLIVDFKELSIVMIHHHRKPSTDDNYDPLSAYNFRGSSRFFDAPDSIISLMQTTPSAGEWARLKTGWQLRQSAPPEEEITLSVLPGGIVKPAPQMTKVTGGALKVARHVKGTWS